MKNCPVCNSRAKDVHFGSRVPVCRACSAFFRRFVLSPKESKNCKSEGQCIIHFKNSTNCRACRMKRCLGVGMRKTAVQGPRDKHKPSQTSLSPSSSLRISSKFFSFLPRLNLLHQNYSELEKSRQQIFQTPDKPKHRNIHEMTKIVEQDAKLVEKFIYKSYKELGSGFTKFEIETLFENYFIRHVIFESPFRGVYAGIPEIVLPNGDFYDKDVERFYTGHIKKPSKVSKESMKLFFQQYWEVYNRTIVNDVELLKLDVFEFLAVSSLMFWDTGLEGFSQKSVELCQNMRTEIISEISIYYKEVKKLSDPCIRLGQIMLLLLSIEKSYITCLEELEMFGFYDIYQQMHTDPHQICDLFSKILHPLV